MYEAANDSIYDTTPTQYTSLATGWGEGAPAPTHGDVGLPATGVSRTRGHCAGNGGLRGHSVGGVFPCVIFAQGNIHEASPKWGFKCPNGETHEGFEDYEAAYLAAGIWLDNRPVSFEPQVSV